MKRMLATLAVAAAVVGISGAALASFKGDLQTRVEKAEARNVAMAVPLAGS